jgi:cyclopropane fatty-acyl-phospholipid synthase-like methyltransferase
MHKRAPKLSQRLQAIVLALPVKKGMRVLEIGCGPGAMAREIAKNIGSGYVLGIDRSASAIRQAIEGSTEEIASGKLSFRQTAIESFELEKGEPLFDIAVAIRVGALDGRHPEIEALALKQIKKALKKNGRLFIDGGDPLIEIKLPK